MSFGKCFIKFKTKLDGRSLFDAHFSTDTTKVLALLARYLSFSISKCHTTWQRDRQSNGKIFRQMAPLESAQFETGNFWIASCIYWFWRILYWNFNNSTCFRLVCFVRTWWICNSKWVHQRKISIWVVFLGFRKTSFEHDWQTVDLYFYTLLIEACILTLYVINKYYLDWFTRSGSSHDGPMQHFPPFSPTFRPE